MSADLVGIDAKPVCSLKLHGATFLFLLRPVTVVWPLHGGFLEDHYQGFEVVVNQGLPEAPLLCHEICCR